MVACLAGLWASAETDASAQARRRRPLFGAAPAAAEAMGRDRARVERPRARRERLVTLAASALDPRTARDGASDLDLRLFTDRRLAARFDRIERRSANSFTWHGRVIGAGGGPVTFVSTNGVVAGTVFAGDAVFEIGYAGRGAHEIRELDPLALPTDDPAGELPVVDATEDTVPVAPLDTAAQIDVLVLWTPAARTAAGGSNAIQSTIDLAIANANTAYANSGITTRLRLVNKAEIAYTESTIGTDLGRLQNTSDTYLDTIHGLRDQYGADLVSLIGAGYTSAGACGIGYLMQSPSTTFANYGFNVVDWSCAAGNLSLAHELGHNQGMHHDVANATGQGAFPYSYGYQDPAGNFRTVMAYACGYGALCPRQPYFSTPLRTFNGVPVGTASADNAQTLNNTAAYVANFRQAVVGACTYALSPTSVNAASGGATQNVTVTATTGCAWSASSSSPTWLTVTGGSGSGTGTMTLTVAANSTSSLRTGTVTAGGQTVTVSQAGQSTGTPPSLTAPSGTVNVTAAEDFAVNVMHDRWDMNDKWDLGWFLHSVDQPAANLTSPTFANGLFTATATTADPSLWLLETGYQPYAALTGRTGARYSIDADKYRRLNLRMCLTGAANQTQASLGQVYWSRGTIYSDNSTPSAFPVYGGCTVYSLDLRTHSVGRMPAIAGLQQFEWTGIMRALRLDPTNAAAQGITLDWASLTAVTDAAASKTITWSGTSPVDLFLDNNNNSADGNLGLLWKDGTAALGVTGGTYTFQFGALPPGDYYVAARQSGTSTYAYSPGFYRVAPKPTIAVLSPSEEGSQDDFATMQLGNAWDMQQATDVERTAHVTSPGLTALNLETTAGVSLPSQSVYRGTAVAGTADPVTWLLWSGGRGQNYRIDTNRYRIMTLEMGVAGACDINRGSIARFVWKRADEALENVSEDVVINHRQGVNSLDTIILDMADRTALPLEAGSGSPSHSGWTGMLDSFRVDPHEFSDARTFWLRRVKLAALERAHGSYTVRWRLSGADPTTRVAIYADTDAIGSDGTLIASDLPYNNDTDGSGSYVWNLTGVAPGAYYLYVQATTASGLQNQRYSRWPITVSATSVNAPVIHLDRPALHYVAARNGAQKTGAQDVGITFSGGVTTWTATPLGTCSFVNVTSGSGTGAGVFTVSIENRTNYPSGASYSCGVRVDAPGALNSPQFVDIDFQVRATGTTRPPWGYVDTPADNVTVSGAFAVTGWALDDIQVVAVSIWRDPVAGEVSTSPNGKIFVVDAVQLEDSRGDVEAQNTSMPFAYRAGWGVLVLSNQLPFNGNGPFRFHAYATDPEGNSVLLGSRRVTGVNATSVLPFGTLDTPSPGATVSGTIPVFGWALTPQPNYIPTDGSTIRVFIDSVMVGNPDYGFYRVDIATKFPGLVNSDGAVGVYILDTTTLANGLHTISWSVRDSAGNTQGLGSRFFRVRN